MNPLSVSYSPISVSISAEPSTPLPWLASAFEAASLWWMGRAIWEIEAFRLPNHQFIIRPTPRIPFPHSHELKWSNFTTIKTLLSENAFPKHLSSPFSIPSAEKEATNQTIVKGENLRTDATIGMLAYGFTDTAIDYFKRGATYAKAQWSLSSFQILCNIGLSNSQLSSLADPNTPDYLPSDTISSLPPIPTL